jgi:hypothetical protein
MNILITVIATFLAIVVCLLIIAIFIPKHYTVEVSTIIRKPKQEVLDYIRMIHNQFYYSEWLKIDDTLKPTRIGNDGEVGTYIRWSSDHPDKNKNVGEGELEIKAIHKDSVDMELRLFKPMPGTCQLRNYFLEINEQETNYICTFSAYAKYPINLPSYVIGRKIIRKTQQKTVDNVKEILESL